MIFKLTKGTEVYLSSNSAQIKNIHTTNKANFDNSGRLFLSQINKSINSVSTITQKLIKMFPAEDSSMISKDFIDFIKDLESDGYLILGRDKTEIKQKEDKLQLQTNKANQVSSRDSYLINNLKHIYIELTNRCNEQCVHCYLPKKRKYSSLSYDVVKKLLDEAIEMKVKNITFTGGEPFLNKDFRKILKYASKLNFNINIQSNLTALNDEYIRYLTEVNISCIQTSIYSTNPTLHDFITKQDGSHKKTVDTLLKLKKHNINVRISFALLKLNYKDFIKVNNWAKSLDFPLELNFDIVGEINGEKSNLAYLCDNDEIIDTINNFIMEDSESLWNSLKTYNKPGSKIIDSPHTRNICGAGVDSIYINSKGNITPCACWQKLEIGNILDTTLKENWCGSEILKEIRNTKLNDFEDYYRKGFYRFISICFARNANLNSGNYKKISERDYDLAKKIELLARKLSK